MINSMFEKVVVLAGEGLARSLGLEELSAFNPSYMEDSFYQKVLSPKEYGNYLPEFWEFTREKALANHSVGPDEVYTELARRDWPIITQNVGGLHQEAGSSKVVEIHGNLYTARCMRCQHEFPMTVEDYRSLPESFTPPCPKCGKNRTRPDITLPGEGMRKRREVEHLLADATTIIYLGVEEESGASARWYAKVPHSVLVNPTPWGSFSQVFTMSPQEWMLAGMPHHR